MRIPTTTTTTPAAIAPEGEPSKAALALHVKLIKTVASARKTMASARTKAALDLAMAVYDKAQHKDMGFKSIRGYFDSDKDALGATAFNWAGLGLVNFCLDKAGIGLQLTSDGAASKLKANVVWTTQDHKDNPDHKIGSGFKGLDLQDAETFTARARAMLVLINKGWPEIKAAEAAVDSTSKGITAPDKIMAEAEKASDKAQTPKTSDEKAMGMATSLVAVLSKPDCSTRMKRKVFRMIGEVCSDDAIRAALDTDKADKE